MRYDVNISRIQLSLVLDRVSRLCCYEEIDCIKQFCVYKRHVCTRHKEELLKESRRSKYRTCSTCVPCFRKSKPSDAVQNISASIALTLYEELDFRCSYGKLICRRCCEVVMKRTDPVKYLYLPLD